MKFNSLRAYSNVPPLMTFKVAYLINQYPKISHAFIRREIRALERRGVEVQRIALRGWDAKIVDLEDHEEQRRTRYVLRDGPMPLILSMLRTLCLRPWRFAAALYLALATGWRADRPLHYHVIYLAEATRMLWWLKESDVRHIHAHFGTNTATILMLIRALGGPSYSFTVHGPDEFDKPEFLHLAEKIRRSAFVVAITSYTRSQLYRWIEHEHWPKIILVHCGIESAFHADVPVPSPVAAPLLVSVGRLSAQKGQLMLIEAARALTMKGVDFELTLVGDGEMRGELEALVKHYGLEGRVRLAGALSTSAVRDEILRARGLVLPSFAEGLPMVIMEAMALRRPVLSTYVAGIPELVLPGKTGWLFPPGSIEALVATMEESLSCPIERLRSMGEAAFERVNERHSIDREIVTLADAFRRVCLEQSPIIEESRTEESRT